MVRAFATIGLIVLTGLISGCTSTPPEVVAVAPTAQPTATPSLYALLPTPTVQKPIDPQIDAYLSSTWEAKGVWKKAVGMVPETAADLAEWRATVDQSYALYQRVPPPPEFAKAHSLYISAYIEMRSAGRFAEFGSDSRNRNLVDKASIKIRDAEDMYNRADKAIIEILRAAK